MTGVTNRVAEAITLNRRPRPIDRASGGFSWASYRRFGETRVATKTPRASVLERPGSEILRPDCRGWPGKMNFPDSKHWPWPARVLPMPCRVRRNPSTAAIFGSMRNRFGRSHRHCFARLQDGQSTEAVRTSHLPKNETVFEFSARRANSVQPADPKGSLNSIPPVRVRDVDTRMGRFAILTVEQSIQDDPGAELPVPLGRIPGMDQQSASRDPVGHILSIDEAEMASKAAGGNDPGSAERTVNPLRHQGQAHYRNDQKISRLGPRV